MPCITPEQIKSLRLTLERSQAEMAKVLDVSERTYRRWEKGEVSPYPKSEIQLVKLYRYTFGEKLGGYFDAE